MAVPCMMSAAMRATASQSITPMRDTYDNATRPQQWSDHAALIQCSAILLGSYRTPQHTSAPARGQSVQARPACARQFGAQRVRIPAAPYALAGTLGNVDRWRLNGATSATLAIWAAQWQPVDSG